LFLPCSQTGNHMRIVGLKTHKKELVKPSPSTSWVYCSHHNATVQKWEFRTSYFKSYFKFNENTTPKKNVKTKTYSIPSSMIHNEKHYSKFLTYGHFLFHPQRTLSVSYQQEHTQPPAASQPTMQNVGAKIIAPVFADFCIGFFNGLESTRWFKPWLILISGSLEVTEPTPLNKY